MRNRDGRSAKGVGSADFGRTVQEQDTDDLQCRGLSVGRTSKRIGTFARQALSEGIMGCAKKRWQAKRLRKIRVPPRALRQAGAQVLLQAAPHSWHASATRTWPRLRRRVLNRSATDFHADDSQSAPCQPTVSDGAMVALQPPVVSAMGLPRSPLCHTPRRRTQGRRLASQSASVALA